MPKSLTKEVWYFKQSSSFEIKHPINLLAMIDGGILYMTSQKRMAKNSEYVSTIKNALRQGRKYSLFYLLKEV